MNTTIEMLTQSDAEITQDFILEAHTVILKQGKAPEEQMKFAWLVYNRHSDDFTLIVAWKTVEDFNVWHGSRSEVIRLGLEALRVRLAR